VNWLIGHVLTQLVAISYSLSSHAKFIDDILGPFIIVTSFECVKMMSSELLFRTEVWSNPSSTSLCQTSARAQESMYRLAPNL
jgi:hypothetical protein